MSLVVAMTEVKPRNVHALVDELFKHRHGPAGRSHRADYLCVASLYFGLGQDLVQIDRMAS